ncbi:MAG: helix-turn-helix domain-containing protein, partial [Holdemanella sp.]|nr:helix-turn-helix domain-containing protein [Holdemanella sp.]
MKYYQLLRRRRIDLNLSIQDVSAQTQLAPEYIEAIEEHNLDVFSDDFSFVRYFVHSYCDAIGVNWAVVQKEVDEDIHAHARSLNHAITTAQRKIVSSMQPAARNRSGKKARTPLQRSLSRLSSSLVGKKKRRYRRLFIIGIAALALLVLFNSFTNLLADRRYLEQEKAQQQELANKEKETEELAKQYAQEKEKKAVQLECEDDLNNVYILKNIENKTTEITFEVTLPEESSVVIYKDGVAQGSEEAIYSEDFSRTVTVNENCILMLQISNYNENK